MTEKLIKIAEFAQLPVGERMVNTDREALQTTEIKLSHEPSTETPKRSKQELIKESS